MLKENEVAKTSADVTYYGLIGVAVASRRAGIRRHSSPQAEDWGIMPQAPKRPLHQSIEG